MLVKNNKVLSFLHKRWAHEDEVKIGATIGKPHGQTSWELFALLLVLLLWGSVEPGRSLAILGDNVGSLQTAITFKSTSSLRAVCKELALHQAVNRWKYSVGHIPTEYNTIADALSRLKDGEDSSSIHVLSSGEQVVAPSVGEFWRAS